MSLQLVKQALKHHEQPTSVKSKGRKLKAGKKADHAKHPKSHSRSNNKETEKSQKNYLKQNLQYLSRLAVKPAEQKSRNEIKKQLEYTEASFTPNSADSDDDDLTDSKTDTNLKRK